MLVNIGILDGDNDSYIILLLEIKQNDQIVTESWLGRTWVIFMRK